MGKVKSGKRKEQAVKTKRKLYESAEKLFREHDFTEVSVDSIVEEAGVSKGTFYVHFESKDALIASFISDYATRLDLDYKTFLDSLPPDMPASSVLLAMIEKIADVLVYTVGYDIMQKVYQMQLTKAVDMDAVKGYGRELYNMFSDILEQGIRRGEFKTDLPLKTLSRHFMMAIRGLCYEWCIRYPDFQLKEEALAHFKILLDGIKRKSDE
ncbi:MAG: TetR/AcrR family transcriptional regulator [Bacillota bacterium]